MESIGSAEAGQKRISKSDVTIAVLSGFYSVPIGSGPDVVEPIVDNVMKLLNEETE